MMAFIGELGNTGRALTLMGVLLGASSVGGVAGEAPAQDGGNWHGGGGWGWHGGPGWLGGWKA
jgi:hypothetical protein